MGKFIDLTGQTFGRLKVIEYAGNNKECRALWLCVCLNDGNEIVVLGKLLRNGHVKSCGCLHREILRKRNISSKGKVLSEETKRKISINSIGMKGKHHTEKAKEILSKINTGKHLSEETKKKISVAVSGINNSRWNPDRQFVKLNKTTRKIIDTTLLDTLKRTGGAKTTHTEIMLGYTKEKLIKHLESKFLPGMFWENHGKWHIDHIKPVSVFVREGVTDPKIINALENLQPLWAKDNMRKRDKYSKECD